MGYRNSVSAVAAALMSAAGGAWAADGAQYLDWRGQWAVINVPGRAGNIFATAAVVF